MLFLFTKLSLIGVTSFHRQPKTIKKLWAKVNQTESGRDIQQRSMSRVVTRGQDQYIVLPTWKLSGISTSLPDGKTNQCLFNTVKNDTGWTLRDLVQCMQPLKFPNTAPISR